MIKATFFRRNGSLAGFSAKGHAGYDEYGRDIVCAAVSSAIMLTVNGITECCGAKADVAEENGEICLLLKCDVSPCAVKFLEALKLHLETISTDYKDNINIRFSEV